MLDISKITKNLIAVSAVSTMLVFWLGTRFVSEAYTQRTNAVQLQISTTPETTLLKLTRAIDEERFLVQSLMLGADEGYDELEKLHQASKNAMFLLNKAIAEIRHSPYDQGIKFRYQYSAESIKNLIVELLDKFERISLATSVIYAQKSLPPSERDESIRMQLFDAHSNLIRDVNNLRTGIRFLPEKNYQGITLAHSLKNSTSNFSESINQTNLLLESYLLKNDLGDLESISDDILSLRVFQQHERAKQSLLELTNFFELHGKNNQLKELANQLEFIYAEEFRTSVSKFLRSIDRGSPLTLTLEQWRDTADIVKGTVRSFEDAAISQTLASAEEIINSATRTLVVDTLLVLLCIGMAIASFSVSRKVQFQADHDDLTQIPNRRKFTKILQQKFDLTDQSTEKLVLMTLDLDSFKAVNDTMGHIVGDKLLKQVAERLQACLDTRMSLARIGGDEFAIVLITSDHNEPLTIAEKLAQVFNQPFEIEDGLLKIDTSIGISNYPDDAATVEELQITSDFAMYFSKQEGGKRIQPYDHDMAIRLENRILIEKDLVNAIEKDQLLLYYQPQINLTKNCVDAVEALVRWKHPTRGLVPPVEFIPVAEESGLMPAIGNWVLNEACSQAADWIRKETHPIRIAINVSVHEIMQPEFVQGVVNALERYKLDPKYLEVEITESVVKTDIAWVVECLQALKDLGIKIALDDFGTGYSSLSQIQDLPLDTLKIDRSFISKLDSESVNSRSVTATIASIADIYGLETVAEGVETELQLSEIINLGINVAQGYYYSKPLESENVVAVIDKIYTDFLNANKAA